MNTLWSYFWPAFSLGLMCGVVAGAMAWRREHRRLLLGGGLVAAIALAALWHGPLGGAARFSARVERGIHATVTYYEMTQVSAHLHHAPLTRQVLLAGPADDFQRSELVRVMGQIGGVSGATWSPDASGIPLIAQGAAVALLGFLLGLLLAYLVELRRRYNAQWNW
jgi:hypothetical protein